MILHTTFETVDITHSIIFMYLFIFFYTYYIFPSFLSKDVSIVHFKIDLHSFRLHLKGRQYVCLNTSQISVNFNWFVKTDFKHENAVPLR